MKLVKNGTELLLEFTSLNEAWYDYLIGAGEAISQDIKKLIDKSKELPKDEQDKVLRFLNKAYAAKRSGKKEEYLKYISMAVQATRQQMALGIQQHQQPKKAIPPPPPSEAYVDDEIDLSQLNEEINMKITQQQLKQIINEEMQKMAEEGVLEEAWYDVFTGAAGAAGQDVAQKAADVKKAVSTKMDDIGTKIGQYKTAGKEKSVKKDVVRSLESIKAAVDNSQASLEQLARRAAGLGLNLNLRGSIKGLKSVSNALLTAQGAAPKQRAASEEE